MCARHGEKPVTPGSRFRIRPVFSKLTKCKADKRLLKVLKRTGGRNNSGKMTVRNIGGGHKKKLREIVKVAFDSVDTDRSGLIDQEELEKVMGQISQDMGAEPPTKEDVKEVMEHLDTDHSGKIDFEEFSQLIKDVLSAMIEEYN